MRLSLRRNGLTSLFKEVRVLKVVRSQHQLRTKTPPSVLEVLHTIAGITDIIITICTTMRLNAHQQSNVGRDKKGLAWVVFWGGSPLHEQ